MAGLDLEELGATPDTPEVQTEVGESVTPPSSEGVDVEGFGGNPDTPGTVTAETGEALAETATQVETDRLRREIEGGVLPELSEENIQALKDLLALHGSSFDSIANDINNQMQQASEWSIDEIITALGSITLTGELSAIENEVNTNLSRIQSLNDGEEIIIQDDKGELIFETKKDAYLYLYYIKYSAFKAQEFISKIGQDSFSSVLLYKGIPILIFLYVGFCVSGSLRRGWGKFEYRVLQRGQRITATTRPEGGGDNATKLIGEYTEYTERKNAITLAKEVFTGNKDILDRFSKPRYELFIDGYIEDVRPGKIQEQSFWRNMYNIINERGALGVLRDIGTSAYYFSKRNKVIEQLETAARVRKEVITYFSTGQGKGEIERFGAYSELDHDIHNAEELQMRDRLRNASQKVLTGDLDYIFGMDFKEAKLEVQTRIGKSILGTRPTPEKILSILGNETSANIGEGGKLVLSEVTRPEYRFLIDMNSYEQIITARSLESRMNGTIYNPDIVRSQLRTFFGSIGNDLNQNRYTYYSASSIIEKILGGADKATAVDLASQESGDILRTRITTPSYIGDQNAADIKTIKEQIITRANTIRSLDEIRLFEEQVGDYMRNADDTFKTGFEDTGRNIERILVEKRKAGLPQTRIITPTGPTPPPTGPTPPPTGPTPPPTGPTSSPEELFRAQAIFEADGTTMTSDAKLLLESNLRLFVLNNPSVLTLPLDKVSLRINQLESIGELLDEVEKTNKANTIRDISNAQAVIIQSTKYLSQDLVERSVVSTGKFSDITEVKVDIRDGKIVVSISENSTILFTSEAGSIDQLEIELKNTFGITDDIPSWESIDIIPSQIHIDLHRTRQYGILRNIDNFFRKAR